MLELANRITTIIQQAVEIATCTRFIAARDIFKLLPDVNEIIAERNQVQWKWQRYKNTNDKRLLNNLQHIVQDVLQQYRNAVRAH